MANTIYLSKIALCLLLNVFFSLLIKHIVLLVQLLCVIVCGRDFNFYLGSIYQMRECENLIEPNCYPYFSVLSFYLKKRNLICPRKIKIYILPFNKNFFGRIIAPFPS